MSLIADGLLAHHKHYADLASLKSLADEAGSLPIRTLVERFTAYNGFLFPEFAGPVVDAIRDACRSGLLADQATAVSMSGRVSDDLLAQLDLRHVSYFADPPAALEPSWRLLESCVNAHQSNVLPRPIMQRLGQASCPGLDLYAVTGATLYVEPCGFQLFDTAQGFYYTGATSRAHTTAVLGSPVLTFDQPVVLIQDIFDGYNFTHFLLDWLTRLAMFANRGPVRAAECLYVFGGVPGEFHRLVLDAARRALGLDAENFFFPTAGVLVRSTQHIAFFSDQCSVDGHPAQMCRPEAMAWIDRLARDIAGPPKAGAGKKLYISRGDVARRAVANEAEVFDRLARWGFEFVRLGDLPIPDQIQIMQSADTVVAAHGMGLVYVALHTRSRLDLIELHHPQLGTDAYAFICQARGYGYVPVLGEIVAGTTDFRVATDRVAAALEPAPVPLTPKSSGRHLTMDPGSADWHPGCQVLPATIATEIAPPWPECVVIKHRRDAASRVYDTNVGWWHLGVLQSLKAYTFSCWVYLPRRFGGDRVMLSVGEPREKIVAADLSRRDVWQPLSMTVNLPSGTAALDLVLRVASEIEAVIYSAGWKVDDAPFPLFGNAP